MGQLWEWESQQKEFIEKMDHWDQAFNSIFEKDSENQVIAIDEQMELRKLQRENKEVLNKLKGKEFSVAVVGNERVGKSTLINALLKETPVPVYTQRCTFTATEIHAGKKSEAEIYFYSREEFNDKFRSMLKTVNYGQTIGDFTDITLSGFEAWWNSMGNCDEGSEQKKTYNSHNASTAEDIKTILREKDLLQKYIGRKPESHPADGTEHIVFITGYSSQDENGQLTNHTAIPYAVKRVVIQSTTLEEDLQNIILYDVPGFDSTTEIHKKMTADMLVRADAIIIVTNVKNPNLTSTQVEMLHKVRDKDDISLAEKAFVFGNYLDSVNTKDVAIENIATLTKGVKEFGIAESHRVVCGSASAYLEANNLVSHERNKTGADKKLDEWGMPYGRDELYQKLVDYHKNELFAVLQKRAKKIMHKMEDYVNGILEAYTPDVLDRVDNGEQYVIETEKAMRSFSRKAWNIIREHQGKVRQESPFSTKIQESIDEIFPLVDEHNELLIQTIEETSVGGGDGLTLSVTEIDANFRKKLRNLLLNNLKDKVAELTGTKQADIREEIVQAFLDAIGCEPIYRDEMAESVYKLFKELRGKKTSGDTVVSGMEECSFNSLIDRFAGSPIAALILHPFGSNERKKEVLEMAKFEFLSLAVYYDSTSGNKLRPEQEKQDIVFTKILVHNDSGGNPVKRNEQGIREFFDRNKDTIFQGISLATDVLPMGKWAKMLLKAGSLCISGKNDDWMDAVKTTMNQSNIRAQWSKMTSKDRNELIERVMDGAIERYCRNKIDTALDDATENGLYLSTIEDRLKELGEFNIPRIGSMEDLLTVLNLDIEILKDIMRRAVIAAIGLERAFNMLIGKNGDFIRAVADDSSFTQIDEWIKKNVRKVRNSRYASLEQEKTKRDTKKNIVEALRAVLDKMDAPASTPTEG